MFGLSMKTSALIMNSLIYQYLHSLCAAAWIVEFDELISVSNYILQLWYVWVSIDYLNMIS